MVEVRIFLVLFVAVVSVFLGRVVSDISDISCSIERVVSDD